MKAIPAIYEGGRIFFPLHHPDYEGPVRVMVIFPQAEEDLADMIDDLCDEDGLEGYEAIPR